MTDTRERLEEVRRRPVGTSRDASIVEEAARFLGEVVEVEQRAVQWLQEIDRSRAGGAQRLEGLTLHEAARRVLEEAGTPLHARELGARIKAGGWTHPRTSNARPEQIVFQLAARLPRYPHLFRRVGPNTFGLAEWGSRQARRSAPRLGTFSGGGEGVGRGMSDGEEPFTEGPPWRSS